jgi:hypothetical protein
MAYSLALHSHGIISGTQKAVLPVDYLQNIIVVPDMVAGGDHIHIKVQKFLYISGVIERPPAEFSPFSITISARYWSMSPLRRVPTIDLPALPTTSPMTRILNSFSMIAPSLCIILSYPEKIKGDWPLLSYLYVVFQLFCVIYNPGFPDYGNTDNTGILHL